jgi:hypothetical protein
VAVHTLWKLHTQGTCLPHCRLYGKVSPTAKHQKVVIQAMHGNTWKRYKVVRTDSRSHWSAPVKATRGNGTIYRAVVTSSRNESATAGQPYRFYNNL